MQRLKTRIVPDLHRTRVALAQRPVQQRKGLFGPAPAAGEEGQRVGHQRIGLLSAARCGLRASQRNKTTGVVGQRCAGLRIQGLGAGAVIAQQRCQRHGRLETALRGRPVMLELVLYGAQQGVRLGMLGVQRQRQRRVQGLRCMLTGYSRRRIPAGGQVQPRAAQADIG